MRSVWTWIVGPALAVLAVGISVLLLTGPSVTAELSRRYSLPDQAGLPQAQMIEIAEQVRAFVVDGRGELPSTVGGRDGFDPAAVSHLVDVGGVIAGARIATGLCAVLVMFWMGILVLRRRTHEASAAFKVGAVLSAALVALAGLAGVVDFASFFSAFHGLFFAEGTWTFPSDSLLIQLFPEAFWATSGLLWAGLTLALALAWWGIGVWLSRAGMRVEA